MSPDEVELANKRRKTSNPKRPAVNILHSTQAQDEDETSSSGTSSSEIDDISEDDEEQDISTQDDDDDNSAHDNDQQHDDADSIESRSSNQSQSGLSGTNDLQTRLQAFLPQLQKANNDLQDPEIARHQRLDHVSDDEETYIEMDLNLGVLEEKSPGREEGEDDIKFASSSTPDSLDEDAGPEDSRKAGVMAHLMGEQESSQKKRKIEELG
ncbi:hypothetical protein B0A52_01286 [Exophiala mesophila]|uniref:Uncharacterized protein n=1 Tax=Exophiala mesophila TaxID=212818 RepID=A0A438NH01_EXOME|nr:hypothetical protein B0A52_01286 [Exophiala mesophila]